MPWLPALHDGEPRPWWRTRLRVIGFGALAVLIALATAVSILLRATAFLIAAPFWILRWLFHIPARQKDIARWRTQWAKTNEAREAASQILTDPTLPPEQLAGLAERALAEEWTLPAADRRAAPLITAIAAHPNTPPMTLADLLNRRPHDAYPGFIRNPVLPLLPLECPDFSRELGGATIRFLLLQRDLPATAACLLSVHPAPLVAFEARMHITLLADSDLPPEERAACVAAWEKLLRQVITDSTLPERCRYANMALLRLAPEWCDMESNPLEDPALWEDVPTLPENVRDFLLREPYKPENDRTEDSVKDWLLETAKTRGGVFCLDPLRCEAIFLTLLTDAGTSFETLKLLSDPSDMFYPSHNQKTWILDFVMLRHPDAPAALRSKYRRNVAQSPHSIERYLLLTHCPRAIFRIPTEDLAQYCTTGDLLTRLALARTLRRWHPIHIALRRFYLARDPNALVRTGIRR